MPNWFCSTTILYSDKTLLICIAAHIMQFIWIHIWQLPKRYTNLFVWPFTRIRYEYEYILCHFRWKPRTEKVSFGIWECISIIRKTVKIVGRLFVWILNSSGKKSSRFIRSVFCRTIYSFVWKICKVKSKCRRFYFSFLWNMDGYGSRHADSGILWTSPNGLWQKSNKDSLRIISYSSNIPWSI